MSLVDELLKKPVYDSPEKEKSALLLSALTQLDVHHHENCEQYASFLAARSWKPGKAERLEELPFLPVRLFKTHELRSIREDEIFKVLTSSGTTGQQVSRVFLDKRTAQLQTRAMVQIMQHFLGKSRMPMLILDHPGVIRNRASFSARGAGILGLSNFGRNHCYVLRDEDMSIDWDKLEAFLDKFATGPVLLFGFTFMVWKYFIKALEEAGKRVDLPNGVLIHSGGWKKLFDEAVDNETFKKVVRRQTGIARVHNFYGMVEQVGSIFVECSYGHLHTPLFADVIVRDPYDWRVLPHGEEGVIQVLSCLPHSYPGHSLLTEDRGVILGCDDCPSGMKGKYFKVLGRLPRAEIRGCSDTHAQEAA